MPHVQPPHRASRAVLASFSLATVMACCGGLARAESETGGFDAPVAEPEHSSEVAIGLGNHLGLGRVDGSTVRLQDLSGSGRTLELGAGYRVTSAVLLGVYATGSKLSGQDPSGEADVVTTSAGLQVNWHARPTMRLDPWLGFGMGWRGIWLRRDTGGETSQGIDLARVQAGLDFRFSSAFALAPVIGADWSLELWNDSPPFASHASSSGARVNALIFTGIMGRFSVLEH
jgi:Outer membrane protein beta-barrel domain